MKWNRNKETRELCFCLHLIPDPSLALSLTWWSCQKSHERIVGDDGRSKCVFLISVSKWSCTVVDDFTELGNYTCQVLYKNVMFYTPFFTPPPQTQSRLEWQHSKKCGKRKNESDWTGIEVSWKEDGFLCSQWKAVITVLSSCSGSS